MRCPATLRKSLALLILSLLLLPLNPSAAGEGTEEEKKSEAPAVVPSDGSAEEGPFSPEALEKAARRIEVRDLSAELLFSFRFQKNEAVPALLDRLEKQAPGSAELFYFQGLDLYRKGERARALLSLQDSVKVKREFDPAWNLMGLILSEADREKEAQEAFRRAVSASPYDPTYAYNLASSLYRTGSEREALDHVGRVIKLKRNFSEAYYLRALIQRDLGNLEEAMDSFEKAKNFGQNSVRFYLDYIRVAEKKGDDRKVLDLCEALPDRENPEALRIHGNIRLKYGEFQKAMRLLGSLAVKQEATLEDQKNYLYAVFKSGRNPYDALNVIPALKERKILLESYLKELNEKERNNPTVRDPIVSPAR